MFTEWDVLAFDRGVRGAFAAVREALRCLLDARREREEGKSRQLLSTEMFKCKLNIVNDVYFYPFFSSASFPILPSQVRPLVQGWHYWV